MAKRGNCNISSNYNDLNRDNFNIHKQTLDPSRLFLFSWTELQAEIVNSLQVYGAIFGAIYLALYSRFSSQWNYLANLYNQIKQAELTANQDNKILIEWKAGFIEDAIALHLARKPMFAVAIKVWTREENVRKTFYKTVHNGKATLKELRKDIIKLLR